MIQIGSKEEVALLLALFGTHTQPVKRPKPKSQRLKAVIPCPAWPNARASCGF